MGMVAKIIPNAPASQTKNQKQRVNCRQDL